MFKNLCFLFIFCSCFSVAFSQTLPLPKNHPIAIAAPHLPLILRYTGQGIVFSSENNKYSFEGNEQRFKLWMDDYPGELKQYKAAISYYLKNTQPAKLNDENKQLYVDLKSQWQLIVQF